MLITESVTEGVRMEVLQLRTGHTGNAGTGISHAGTTDEGHNDLSGALDKSCAVSSAGHGHDAHAPCGSTSGKKEETSRARLPSSSGSEGDDVLAHISKAPSLTVSIC